MKRRTKKRRDFRSDLRVFPWFGAAVLGVALSADGALGQDQSVEAEPAAPEETGEETLDAEEEESPPEFTPWVGGNQEFSGWADFTVGGAMVSGNKAEFQRRTGINSSVFGGVSDFGWEQFVGDNGFFTASGKVLGGLNDYDVKLSYDHTDVGYVRMGASRYRHWYNGSGGYDPSTGAWFPLADQDLSLDRSSIWIEGGLTIPDKPEISVRYEHRTRKGQKDSTIWGTTSPVYGGRGIAASVYGIDEVQDIVSAEIKHSFGITDAGLGLTYEHLKLDNSLDVRRQAGGPAQTYTTQNTGVESDLFNVHAFTDTRFNEKVGLAFGYSYTALDTDVSGDRIVGLAPDPVYDPALARYPGFLDLEGGSQLQQQVVTLTLPYRPLKNISVVPSFQFESVGRDSSNFYTPTPNFGSASRSVASEQDSTDLSGRLEFRYTGFTNLVLYARGNWEGANGNLNENQIERVTGTTQMARDTDFDRFTQQYTAGVNWYPRRRINTAFQYYYRDRDNNYDHLTDSTGNGGTIRYPAYLTSQYFNTHDANVRVTWRPVGTLVSVTRFDYQLSTIDTGADGNAAIQSADVDSRIISQSLTWSPLASLYLHGNFSYVLSNTETPANEPAPSGVILESKNNYWNTGLAAGYNLKDRTDFSVDYQYYEADNFEDNSTASQPYGAGFQEHRVTAAIAHRLKENMRLILGYSFFTNNDVTYGGYNDYTANVVYTTLQWRY